MGIRMNDANPLRENRKNSSITTRFISRIKILIKHGRIGFRFGKKVK
jgi:hypothetical protein